MYIVFRFIMPHKDPIKLYFCSLKDTKLLTAKRIKHHEAVTRIIELNDMSKQSEMVTILVKKIFEMLSNSLENLSRIKSEVKDIEMVKYNQDILNGIFILV